MNRKQLITLLVLVVLIGGACLMLLRNQNKSWEGANPALGKKLLGEKHMRKSDRPSPMGDMGEQGWPDGRYVKVPNTENVSLVSEPFDKIEPKPEQWLNKDFFKIEKARSVAVTFPNATNSWKLTREAETGEWKLAEAKPTEQLDASKASGGTNRFSSASFVDVATNGPSAAMDKHVVDRVNR